MKYDVRIGGKTRVVELARNSEKWRISLDGNLLDVDAVEVAPNTFSILFEGESFEVRVAPLPDGSLTLHTGVSEFTRKWKIRAPGAAVATAQSKRKAASRLLHRCREKWCACS